MVDVTGITVGIVIFYISGPHLHGIGWWQQRGSLFMGISWHQSGELTLTLWRNLCRIANALRHECAIECGGLRLEQEGRLSCVVL